MGWLKYNDDEVNRFHPEFEKVAKTVLRDLNLDREFHWEHHPSPIGSSIIPDFVLVHTITNRWCLVVEIKRNKSAVFSTRNQIQAKGYAEENSTLFRSEWPLYFVVSNLEMSILFALNGPNPPKLCRIKDMSFHSGNFTIDRQELHLEEFRKHLLTIINFCVNEQFPVFESFWPRYVKSVLEDAKSIQYDPAISYGIRSVNEDVSNYYAGSYSDSDKTQLLLRCLLAEFVHGILKKYKHPLAKRLSLRRSTIQEFVNSIEILQTIDFSGIFESDICDLYEVAKDIEGISVVLAAFISGLIKEEVEKSAEIREDSIELPDLLVEEFYPLEIQEKRGKAQTDPDLAYLLASIAIEFKRPTGVILDPGCGDGSLLSAAYDVLREGGKDHKQITTQIRGIEIDPIASKIAALRLVLKEPYSVSRTDKCPTYCRDMFDSKEFIENAEVILMNPPFKRYEAQDSSPIPKPIREYFASKITEDGGKVETNVGQANLYHLYVEYIVKTSSPDTVLGIILDNKWYHNKYASVLRELMLKRCSILALVEYPHDMYFKNWTIATSMVFLKVGEARNDHEVAFVRARSPYKSDFIAVAKSISGQSDIPNEWTIQKVLQNQLLSKKSWKENFSVNLENEFRNENWPTLDDLFKYSRRGSLAKEGGGIAVFEFPFNRSNYGPRRALKKEKRSKFQTEKGRNLTTEENILLRNIADNIDNEYKGYAIQNADQLDGYKVGLSAVLKDQTLETPKMRNSDFTSNYFAGRRVRLGNKLDEFLQELDSNTSTNEYITAISQIVGLDNTVLSSEEIWTVLREPYAGELIIPRKLRVGHRVHINEFAYNPNGKQIRLSSNFFSYSFCIAVEEESALDQETAVELITAFLLSSFGQLQFEIEAFNREGARSIEQHQLKKIRIFDPRWIDQEQRNLILQAFRDLPYPIPTDKAPYLQPKLVALDKLFAAEIVKKTPNIKAINLLEEVHQVLFEWIEIRRP